MSTTTTFKRIALVAVAALSLGVLSVAPSQAQLSSETLTIDASADTVTVNDTATAVLTHSFDHTSAAFESSTIRYTCSAPIGGACIVPKLWQTDTSDTANTLLKFTTGNPTYFAMSSAMGGSPAGWTDSSTATAADGVRSVINVKVVSPATAGTYTYRFYTVDNSTNVVTGTPLTWTVTASAANTTASQLSRTYIGTAADDGTASRARIGFKSSTDSGVVCSAGLASAQAQCAVAFIVVANSAAETKTAIGSGFSVVAGTVSVTITGAGVISSTNNASSGTSSASLVVDNTGTLNTAETLTILSNGTAGVGTITYTSAAGVTLGSQTVTFTGTPASAAIALSDTIVSLTAGSTIVGTVKDSGGSVMKSGTVYVYSSDTNVAGTNLSTNAYPTTATGYTIPSTGVLAYTLTTADTGVATITLRDSWTVAASTWTSNEVVVDVRGSTIVSLTVAFDKATYSPGERAVITYTAKDSQGKGMATAAITGLTAISNATMTDVTTASITGTNSGASPYNVLGTSFQGFKDTGVETRVVTMPTYAGAVNLTNTFATFGSVTSAKTTVTSTATVVDAAATAQAAATAAAKDASDAATDAALEATDAAYAATDAANIAAEAADAATAAAEAATEAANAAKESADAATAAVEELATSVAKLMAALQAQITTLAKVVAKIAVKVKA